jgi:hypothetical protein
MLPAAMVIYTPGASTRMLTTPLLPIISPWFDQSKALSDLAGTRDGSTTPFAIFQAE